MNKGITFTRRINDAHRFASWTEAGNFAGANHGSKGPIPHSWRLMEIVTEQAGPGAPTAPTLTHTVVHIPGLIDQYVKDIGEAPKPHPDFKVTRAGSTFAYEPSEFVRMWEDGAVFLIDEIDMPDYEEPDNSDEEPDQLAPGD